MESEEFSSRNQSIGCALAWVTIARDSEYDYPFYRVWQFRGICAGHLRYQIGTNLTKFSLSVNSGSYCPSAIFGPRVYGNPIASLFTHCPVVWTVKSSVVGTRVLAVL